eukprot:CAMPEP_0169157692 /NCGR_PEP_ID=MMETSP1015-20121227/54730_1 /TAXON_ID=342587 /ORGANISM="Karlodinium micrum, Strain CCMP2283" /LENGTH=319 /DNA_ID=CAMNT_0009228665 /DNA_START=220 /DNA_END=1179 /DNA_ORIENTATION=+
MQKKVCKEFCKGVIADKEDVAEVAPQKTKLRMEVVNENMHATALIKVKRSDLYKRAWPKTCDGKNKFGEFIIGLSTERFLCNPDDNTAHDIDSPGYRQSDDYRIFACCKNKCQDSKTCNHVTYTFAEAAKSALSTAALKADHVVTEAGRKVQINVQKFDEAVVIDGVHAAVEVRMPDSALEFENRKAELTKNGEAFLLDLAGSLGPLISMQISAYETLSKVVICTHAETTGTLEQMRGNPLELLPKHRADTVRRILENVVPHEVASLGDGIAHYNEEVPGYTSGRRGFIIYKLYDANFDAPTCDSKDLHRFVSKYADKA